MLAERARGEDPLEKLTITRPATSSATSAGSPAKTGSRGSGRPVGTAPISRPAVPAEIERPGNEKREHHRHRGAGRTRREPLEQPQPLQESEAERQCWPMDLGDAPHQLDERPQQPR